MDQVKETFYMDFYGTLLTDHQQDILRMVIMEDYSLAEIAQELGITRQGVHDGVQRGLAKLEWYEEHLGLYKKHLAKIEKIQKVIKLLEASKDVAPEALDLLEELLDS